LLAQKLEERAAPKVSLSGVRPLAKRMKNIVSVILGVTAILAGLTFAIINESHYLRGYAWALPYLFALIVLLLVLATRIVIVNSRTDRENKTESPPPPAVEVRQENNQEFNPQFNPQQNFYFGTSDRGTVAAEPDETATSIRAFLKSAHPHSAYTADEIAKEFNLTKKPRMGRT
jgi:hypothetical protein